MLASALGAEEQPSHTNSFPPTWRMPHCLTRGLDPTTPEMVVVFFGKGNAPKNFQGKSMDGEGEIFCS